MNDYINLDYKIGNGYYFPSLNKDSFEINKKSTSWFFPPDLNQIRRSDYISLLSLNNNECTIFWKKIINNYINDLGKYGLDYKDHIFNRFYFKDFHIRENVRDLKNLDIKQVRYYYYSISDFGDHYKKFDDRILSITAYTSAGQYISIDGSWQIFVSHIPALVADIINKDELLDKVGFDENIPLFMLDCESENITDYIADSSKKHQSISKYKKYNKDNLKESIIKSCKVAGININESLIISKTNRFYDYVSQAVIRFAVFNYYMLNKVEEEQEVSMDNFETSGTIAECVKAKAYMDKKIRINLDRDYNIRLNVNPKRRNIYSHDNKVIRRLCDYKFQVCAHWHSYWYGSKNKPEERHKERKWVEAYYKNEDKEFNIVKERYKKEEKPVILA